MTTDEITAAAQTAIGNAAAVYDRMPARYLGFPAFVVAFTTGPGTPAAVSARIFELIADRA